MTTTILSYISIGITIASLILPSWQIFYNKKKNGLSTITKIGWGLVFTSIMLIVSGIWNIKLSAIEKINDDKALRDSLTASFNLALKHIDSTLKFDPSANRIVNKYFNNNNAVVINGGSDINFINSPISAPHPRPLLSTLIDTAQFFSNVKKFQDHFKIYDKNVYFFLLTYTNGNEYFMDLKKMFNARNYTVIEPAIGLRIESFKNPTAIEFGISLTINNGKMGVVIGRLY